jgi:hypothetical protein
MEAAQNLWNLAVEEVVVGVLEPPQVGFPLCEVEATSSLLVVTVFATPMRIVGRLYGMISA